jgi:hypothetical protein
MKGVEMTTFTVTTMAPTIMTMSVMNPNHTITSTDLQQVSGP